MTPRLAAGAAPGKLVLFGEHAVVYGRPAIAATLGRGLGATAESDPDGPSLHIPAWGLSGLHVRLGDGPPGFESVARAFAAALDAAELEGPQRQVAVTVDGELPPGVGLGSSAAFSIAVLRALAAWRGGRLTGDALLAAAHRVEQVFHGTPSGLDHTTVAVGGLIRFRRTASGTEWERLPLAAPLPVVVAFAPRDGGTRDVVARLRTRYDAHRDLLDPIFDAIGHVANQGAQALAAGDLERIGVLLDVNHGLLNACGVSAPINEELVAIARGAGALGAKLTGAGGGGAIVALVPRDTDRVLSAFEARGVRAFATLLGAG